MSGALLTSPTTMLSLTMKVLSNQWMLAFKRQRLKIIQLLAFKTMVGAILVQLASHMTSMATQLNQIYAINNLAATGKTLCIRKRALLMRVNGSTAVASRSQCPESSKTSLAMSRTNTSVKRWLTKRATTQLDCRTMVSAGLIAHPPMISSELHKTAESWALSRPTSCGLRLSKFLSTNTWAATRMKNRN